jgi:hypothetical protein
MLKENIKEKRKIRVYVLTSECQVIGIWTNLLKLCTDRNEIEKFPSYSKLSKEIALLRKDGAIADKLDFTTKWGKVYTIQIDNIQ